MKIINILTKASIISSLFLFYTNNSLAETSTRPQTAANNQGCRKTDNTIDSLTQYHFEIILGSEKGNVRTAIWVNRVDMSYLITKTGVDNGYTCIVETSSEKLYINKNAIKDIAANAGKKN